MQVTKLKPVKISSWFIEIVREYRYKERIKRQERIIK